MKGEVGLDLVDEGKFLGNDSGISSGGDDARGRGKLLREFSDDFSDQAAVANNSADLHGVCGRFADGAWGLFEFDVGKEGGAFGEIVFERGKARGDDAAEISCDLRLRWSCCRDYVESDCGAKIDHNGGLLGQADGGGVGKTIRADFGWIRIVDLEGEFALAADAVNWDFKFTQSVGRDFGNGWDDGAQGGLLNGLAL